VLLLCIRPRAQQSSSKFRNLPLQAKDRTSELRSCAKRFGDLAATTLSLWASRSFIWHCLHN